MPTRCRKKQPRLSEEGAEMLRNEYVKIRREHREKKDEGSFVPITVR